jgi:hypothetical protein
MILVAYKNPNGEIRGGLYDNYEQYIKETFSPECEHIAGVAFKIKGKTYAERKDYLRNIAIRTQSIEQILNLFQGEYGWLNDWFEEKGKRYGLVHEFKENRIC